MSAWRSLITIRWIAPTMALALALLIASPALAGDWQGQDVTEEGVRHVRNPKTPMEAPITVELEEQWRLGGDTDNEDELFGVISEIIVDDESNIYLLDAQLNEVKIFDTEGNFVNAIGREGEGPGEFRRAADEFFLPDGTVGVLQLMPGRLVKLTPEGEPAGDHPLPKNEEGGFVGFANGNSRSDLVVMHGFTISVTEAAVTHERSLYALSPEGTEAARFHTEERLFELANPVIDENVWDTFDRRWTIGPDQRVYAVLRNGEYRIHVWTADGRVDRVIERDYEPIPRTDAEKERVYNIYDAFTRASAPGAKVQVNDYHRGVENIFVRDDGSLWVLTTEGVHRLEEGQLGSFDVYDSEGRFVRQVTLKGEGNPKEDGLYFVKDRLYVVTDFLSAAMAQFGGGGTGEEDDAEPMSVICYRLDDKLVAMR